MSDSSTERRLRHDPRSRFGADEEIVAWCRAWASRDRPLHFLLAARHRDFAVVTDQRLLLISAGFFSRRPHRRVLADRLDEVSVTPTERRSGRCLRVEAAGHADLLLELGRGDRGLALADAVLRAASQAQPVPRHEPSAPSAAPAPVSEPASEPISDQEA